MLSDNDNSIGGAEVTIHQPAQHNSLMLFISMLVLPLVCTRGGNQTERAVYFNP